jgi:UDP-GlcNAc:undecaprenyl-phosphate/decaprenyl-phosphate GlcNAc-1-phosphate transferase
MSYDSIPLNFLSIFSIISFFIFLLIQKFSNRLFAGKLLDNDFTKPQAFHEEAISRVGGLASILLLFLYIYLHNLFFSEIFYEYLVIGTGLFLVGFLDDLKINLKPMFRLSLMVIILLLSIYFFSLDIKEVDLIFLDTWLQNKFFLMLFILFCFLFIINGSNLIDGFNGLLVINLLIINLSLAALNLEANASYSLLLIAQIIILSIFLLFNFPKAKIFFGDSGSYLFGSLTALNIIYTNNFNGQVSSFFFCILLGYIFFEVFFSFFRKIYIKKSPLEPDNTHLHMLVYKHLNRTRDANESNYKTSVIINFVYFCFILPSFFLKNNGTFCKIWFVLGLILYLYSYYKLYKKNS